MPNYLSLSRPTRKTVRRMKHSKLRNEAELFKKLEDLGIQFAKEARDSKRELIELDKFCQGNNQDKIFNKKTDIANNVMSSIKKLRQQSSVIKEELDKFPERLSDLTNQFFSVVVDIR